MTSLTLRTAPTPAIDSIRVAVVIPCFEQAHFLGDAIESALAQTHPSTEILVIDDGSPDHTAEVAAAYEGVRYIHQENQGLSAARNTGLAATDAEFVVFLDSDDRLLGNAVRANLQCLLDHPDAGLAYGAYRHIDAAGNPLDLPRVRPAGGDPFAALLRRNVVEMHGAVLYRSGLLRQVGGFDRTLPASEDYDAYLRVAAVAGIAHHQELVAEYRKYAGSMSFDARLMLANTLRVLRRQKERAWRDPERRRAFRAGVKMWRGYYGPLLVDQVGNRVRGREPRGPLCRDAIAAMGLAPMVLAKRAAKKLDRETLRPLRRQIRIAMHRLVPGRMILVYHRVARVPSDAWGLCVTPEHFAQHLEVLHRTCDVVSLTELAQRSRVARPTVAITFDDGYVDNLRTALPLLQQRGTPATVFVSGGAAPSTDEFWWDTLERIVLQTENLPARPTVHVDGVPYRFDLADWADYPAAHAVAHRSWRAETNTRPTPRHTMFQVLYRHLAGLPDLRRAHALATLASDLDVATGLREEYRRMTAAEVRELGATPGLDIGGHTVHHPLLSALSPERQRQEIAGNRDHLAAILGRPVRTFAYPHGDYDDHAITALRDLDFTVACTTRGQTVTKAFDRLELPRHAVDNWDGGEFEQRLREAWLV